MTKRSSAAAATSRADPAFAPIDDAFGVLAGVIAIPRDARRQAREHARAVIEGASLASGADETAVVARLAFAAELIDAMAVELAAHVPELRSLIDELEDVAGMPRLALGSAVLRAPGLLSLPTGVAVEVQLALLLAFSGAACASLWTLSAGGGLGQIATAGEFNADARAPRRLARTLLESRAPSPVTGELAGALIERGQASPAALIVRGREAVSPGRLPLLEACAPGLGATLERDELLARSAGTDEEALAATERRLARLRFDLHDGPQQDVVLLAEDLRLFQSQLSTVLDGQRGKGRLLGRLEDLQARLVALDGDLRRISASLQSPFLQPGSLPDALAELTDSFAARTGIEPEVELDGDMSGLTDSQHITLLGLIREALSNIREHSEAEHVSIRVSCGAAGVDVRVTDDGRGFDPETSLVRAAREGHLGLVGMHERVRLLGGRTQIESKPGGPTVISARLPAAPAGVERRG